jgi:CubicO group peptidase (beta-lactamase class C family)
MHDKVFSPLGMKDTLADESDKIIPSRARWYTIMADGTYWNTPYEDLSYKWAGGGFLSTAEDLARFGSALLKPGFLKRDTLAMILSRQETNAGKKTKYGLIWFIHDTRGGGTEPQFEHSGGVAGSSSWLVIYPDQGVVIAWVQNSNDFRDWPIANVSVPFFSHRK